MPLKTNALIPQIKFRKIQNSPGQGLVTGAKDISQFHKLHVRKVRSFILNQSADLQKYEILIGKNVHMLTNRLLFIYFL